MCRAKLTPSKTNLTNVSRKKMDVSGTCIFSIGLSQNSKAVRTIFLVSKSIVNKVIIGMPRIQVLRLLPSYWLTNIGEYNEEEVRSIQPTEYSGDKITLEQKAQVENLLDEFANVLTYKLTNERCLKFYPSERGCNSISTTNTKRPLKNYKFVCIMEQVPSNQASPHLTMTFVVIKTGRSMKN
jgi:hypothetical protein